jgi:hypothetical protein
MRTTESLVQPALAMTYSEAVLSPTKLEGLRLAVSGILNGFLLNTAVYGADPVCIASPQGGPPCAIAITQNGNVGIGIVVPDSSLHVAGDVHGEVLKADLQLRVFRVIKPDSTNFEFFVWSENRFQPGVSVVNLEAQGGRGIHLNTQQEIILATMQHPRLTVTPEGYVGVGTMTPGRTFEVLGNAGIKVNAHPAGNAQITFAQGGPDRAYVTYWNAWETLAMTSAIGTDGVHFHPASGNVGIGTPTPGSKLDVNGKLRCEVLEVTSDRNAKTNIRSLDRAELLRKLGDIEVFEWEYTNSPGVRHVGPMAQDFHGNFGVGSDDRHINPMDAASIAIASVQALKQELKGRDERLLEKDRQLSAMRKDLSHLLERMQRIERLLGTPGVNGTASDRDRSAGQNAR